MMALAEASAFPPLVDPKQSKSGIELWATSTVKDAVWVYQYSTQTSAEAKTASYKQYMQSEAFYDLARRRQTAEVKSVSCSPEYAISTGRHIHQDRAWNLLQSL